MLKKLLTLRNGLLASAALCFTGQGAVVFTDTFDHPGNSLADFQAAGWTAVYGTAGDNLGTGASGNAGATETVFWGNPTAGTGNTEAALEYNYMAAPISCGDILTIEANCMRFEGYSYLREIILWDGSNPGTRVAVATLSAVGKALGPYATWWTPPAKDRIEPLVYEATAADNGKYVIFKYGHSAGWGETADVSFSIEKVTLPIFTQQPMSFEASEGETASFSVVVRGCTPTFQWKKNGVNIPGQNMSTLDLTAVTVADAGEYVCAVSNSYGTTNSATATLIVYPKAGGGASTSVGISFSHIYSGTPFNPAVTDLAYGLAPSRWKVTTTSASSSEMYSAGAGFYTVIWQANNTYWVGGLPSDLNPGNEQVNFAYLDDSAPGYSVTVTGLKSGIGFDKFVVRTIAASDNATNFNTVTVTDDMTATSQTLTYGPVVTAREGYTGKAAVSSASTTLSTDSLTISSVRLGDTLTRGCLAGFIITDKPVILAQPQAPAGVVFNGESFSLSAEAFGVETIGYQWRKDGVAIAGATTSSFSKASAVVDDSGTYDLVVTNAYGTAVSVPAAVTVVSFIQPTVVKQPASASVYLGGVARFTAEGYGGQLSYQWNKNGAPIAGATTTVLTLSGITAADEADYTVTITNPAGTTNSEVAHLTVLAIPTTGYAAKVLVDGPLGYWRLGELSGTVAKDSFGGFDGTIEGAVGLGEAGLAADDTAMRFPNSGWTLATPSTYVDVPYTTALNPSGPFSVELWVKPNGLPADLFSPLSSLDINAGRAGYLFYMKSGGGWEFRLGNTSGAYVATVSGGLPSTDWQHLVGVYDGSMAYLYVNGVQYGPVTPSAAFTPNPSVAFRIGSPTGFSRPWNGLVDEVAFYNKALTPAQVQAHFQAAPIQMDLGTVGNVVPDTKPVGMPHHAINQTATWAATDGARSGVMQFNASTPSLITAAPTADMNGTSGTISFWVRYDQAGNTASGNEAAMVYDRRDAGGSGSGTIIAVNHGHSGVEDGTVFFQANPSGANPFSSVGKVNDGAWHHVAVTYSQGAGEIVTIYIDGVLDASSPNTLAWYWPAGVNNMFGQSRDTYWRKLQGALDDFRLYNRILTDAEIVQIKNGDLVDNNALVVRYNFDTAPIDALSTSWSPGVGTLQSADKIEGPWTDVTGAASPYLSVPTGAQQYFRVKVQ